MDKEAVKNAKTPRPVAASVVKLRAAVEKASAGGGAQRVEAQKARGKFTARERIHYLLDEGTFQELDLLVTTRATDFGLKDKDIPGDGVITGFGQVNGKEVCVYAQDFTVLGGSLGLAHARPWRHVDPSGDEHRHPRLHGARAGGGRSRHGPSGRSVRIGVRGV